MKEGRKEGRKEGEGRKELMLESTVPRVPKSNTCGWRGEMTNLGWVMQSATRLATRRELNMRETQR